VLTSKNKTLEAISGFRFSEAAKFNAFEYCKSLLHFFTSAHPPFG